MDCLLFSEKRAHIIYSVYVDEWGNKTIGGAQSYLCNLAKLLHSIGFFPIIYQRSTTNYLAQIGDYQVVGIADANDSRRLIKGIDEVVHNYDTDLLIFGSDHLVCKNNFKHCVSIQHGISWDITEDNKVSNGRNLKKTIKGLLKTISIIRRNRWCQNIVCVDYNFLNWFRTQVAHIDFNIQVIPNFAHVPKSIIERHEEDNISVVFARRFVDHRGTKLFAKAIIELSQQYPQISFTLAGVGPDEDWLHQRLDGMSNVQFTTYRQEDSIVFHSNFDIAVIPTKGAEGTSLSLLEAMAAGCAVIATNVGGLTNIVIDGFNGLLIDPNENELIDALQKLITDSTLRHTLSQRAYETVRESFSYERWAEKWISFIRAVYNEA